MKILPPEDPRRIAGTSGPDAQGSSNGPEGARHYHYHAGADAEERIRRDAVRDYLHERTTERESYRRAVILTIFGLIVIAVFLGAVLTPRTDREATASGEQTAVQVTSELKDGKWVATAKRVPATGSADSDSDEEAAAAQVAQAVDDSELMPNEPSATSLCQGQFASTEGMVVNVQGHKATMWFEDQVRNGQTQGRTAYGEPVGAGLSFADDDGAPSIIFSCETDHMLVTRLSDYTSLLVSRVDRDQAAHVLAEWRGE